MGNFDGDSGTVFEESYATTNGGGKVANGNGAANFSPPEKEELLSQRKFSAPAYTEIRTRRCHAKPAVDDKVSGTFWRSVGSQNKEPIKIGRKCGSIWLTLPLARSFCRLVIDFVRG